MNLQMRATVMQIMLPSPGILPKLLVADPPPAPTPLPKTPELSDPKPRDGLLKAFPPESPNLCLSLVPIAVLLNRPVPIPPLSSLNPNLSLFLSRLEVRSPPLKLSKNADELEVPSKVGLPKADPLSRSRIDSLFLSLLASKLNWSLLNWSLPLKSVLIGLKSPGRSLKTDGRLSLKSVDEPLLPLPPVLALFPESNLPAPNAKAEDPPALPLLESSRLFLLKLKSSNLLLEPLSAVFWEKAVLLSSVLSPAPVDQVDIYNWVIKHPQCKDTAEQKQMKTNILLYTNIIITIAYNLGTLLVIIFVNYINYKL